MATYVYPTSAELMEIEQSLLPTLTMDDPVFDLMPMVDKDADLVMWEQEDDYIGLQQLRSLNAQAHRVNRVGLKRYKMEPGYYGEFNVIDEDELTRRRKIGSFNEPITITDLVMRCQEQLLHRRLNRLRYIAWTLLSTGTFSISSPDGGVMHTDTYSLQTFSASTPWSTAASATPWADFQAVQIKSRGYSVEFNSQAKAFMNRSTWNELIKNTNAADIYGRRTQGLATANSLEDVNKILMGEDLPQIVVYDKTYKDENGTAQLFVPNDKVVVVGKRDDNRPIMEYQMTRNANNPDLGPGPFTTVVDSADHGEFPRSVKCYDFHNGGPAIFFPSAVCVMSV